MKRLKINGDGLCEVFKRDTGRKHSKQWCGIYPRELACRLARYLRKKGFEVRLYPRGHSSNGKMISNAPERAVYALSKDKAYLNEDELSVVNRVIIEFLARQFS